MLANQLVTAEAAAADLKELHDQSMGAAQQARQAVQDNAMMLQEKMAQRTKLLSQLEQAKMQEQVSASLNQMGELAAPRNTPSLEEVRDKIERRYANALGPGRSGHQLGAGPDAGGPQGDHQHGRSGPAGRDPGLARFWHRRHRRQARQRCPTPRRRRWRKPQPPLTADQAVTERAETER